MHALLGSAQTSPRDHRRVACHHGGKGGKGQKRPRPTCHRFSHSLARAFGELSARGQLQGKLYTFFLLGGCYSGERQHSSVCAQPSLQALVRRKGGVISTALTTFQTQNENIFP